jgi:membrane protease YdiL (CAAX protease family)
MTMLDTPRTKIALFLALTFGFSAYFYWRIIAIGMAGEGAGNLVLGLMWCPGIAAILTRLITQRNLAGQGWIPWPPGPLGLAFILPILYAAPVYGLAWASGIGGFNPDAWSAAGESLGLGATPIAGLAVLATLGVAISLVSATGEEIGWRGLLVPELAKVTGFRDLALISGGIWAAWHMPILIFGGYNAGTTPFWFQIICFATMAVGLGTMLAWLRLKSGSLWPAALLHATHNLFVQGVFDAATVDRGRTYWLTGEFGLGLALMAVLMGLWAMRRMAREPA